MKVLIVPEDSRNDQYILKPLFERLFASFSRPNTTVVVCGDPVLRGVSEALKEDRLADIIRRYRVFDIIILCVDRDGVATRRQRLDQLEAKFATGRIFVAVNAWEELETWLLAGLDLPKDWAWADIRAEISVKERYFEPFARLRGLTDRPGGGRQDLGKEAARRLPSIRRKCREDFGELANRLRMVVKSVR